MSRRALLNAAFAVWGLAIAISLATVWTKPAPPGQLPGLATRLGFDAHGPMRWMIGMIVLPVLVPLLLRPVARRLEEGAAWARNATLIAPLIALWFVTITRAPLWVIAPVAAVIGVCALLRDRDLEFTRHDVVLVPTFLATLLGVNDAAPSLGIDRVAVVALLIVFALRVAIALLPGSLPPALAFIAAPFGLILQTGFFARDQRYFGWHALAIAVITPFVLRFARMSAARAASILVFVTLPVSIAAYMNATSVITAEGKPRVNIFEDTHMVLPASEYLAGELPYRDIIPSHGLLHDGLLDFLIMKTRGVSMGTVWKTRATLSTLTVAAVYALAWALTGSPHAAFFAVLLAMMTNTFAAALRWLPALAALALMCGAVRLRRARWLRYAAIATVISGMTSLDFGAYTLATLLLATMRFAGDRLQALREVAIGIAIPAVPLFAGLAVLGILDDFFRTTFVELLSLGPAYTLGFFAPSNTFSLNFPEVLAGVFTAEGFLYLIWVLGAVIAGVLLARRASRRFEPLLLVAVFIVLCAISYAERQHLYHRVVAAPFAVALTWLLLRRRSPFAPAAVVVLLALAAPTTHIAIAGWMRDSRGPVEKEWVEIPEIPRARGALFLEPDAAALRGVQKYVSLALAPDETWLDFSNRGLFYFLLRRDCPIREPEVAFYERDERQREVVRKLESDPRIRAVLLTGPSGRYRVDGIPNEERAPIVSPLTSRRAMW